MTNKEKINDKLGKLAKPCWYVYSLQKLRPEKLAEVVEQARKDRVLLIK